MGYITLPLPLHVVYGASIAAGELRNDRVLAHMDRRLRMFWLHVAPNSISSSMALEKKLFGGVYTLGRGRQFRYQKFSG